MNHRGVTIFELLAVIVVIGIIASISVVLMGNIIQKSREDSFLNTANVMISSSQTAFDLNDSIWDDNIVTLQELIDNNYIQVSADDPWGQPYDTTNSFVQYEDSSDGPLFKVRLISPTATIGFDIPLEVFDKSDVIYIENDSSFINGIIELITGNLLSNIAGDNGDDQITVEGKIGKGGSIDTFGGDDIIIVSGGASNDAYISSGTGNDSITLESPMIGAATINSGDGDDTIIIPEIRYLSNIFAGAGNDNVTIGSVTTNFYQAVDMGSGNDTLTINANGITLSQMTYTNVRFKGEDGEDILNLPYVSFEEWESISSMFDGFETINLSDTTINN